MRLIRLATAALVPLGMLVGSTVILSGCGDSSTANQATVQEAPPMTPEQKKDWDKFYNKQKATAAAKKRAK